MCEDRKCSKRHLYTCRYLNSRSGCGRGESCHPSHRLERKLQDEENGDIDKSKEMTPNEEKSCDSDELRKGKLGEGNFEILMPRGMGSTATDKPMCENTFRK